MTLGIVATGDGNDRESVASAETALESVASAETALESVASAPTATPASAGTTGTLPELRPVSPDEYVERRRLASGGMGTITVARDRRLGRQVALKELRARTPELRARFAREALLTAQLEHPGIVSVHEAGTWPSGEPFYAMRLVPGQSLDRVLAETTSVEARIALLPHLIAVAEALAFAHDQRVIHRDLKPHNIMVGKFGETVVIDWGLAKNLDDADDSSSAVQLPASGAQTVAGAVMGTPAYMPPEQARGEPVDERADVYAIGAILFHVLAGKAPHAGSTLEEIVADAAKGTPVNVREQLRGVPLDLVAIVERAMAPDARDRYPSARELAVDLRRFQTGQLVGAHRYTFGERVRRFVRRNKTAVAIGAVALLTVAVVAVVALEHVMSARRIAERERGIAQARLTSSYIDRARVELAARRPESALAYAIASGEHAPLDLRTRFLAARALESLPAYQRRPGTTVRSAIPVPDSHDFIYADAEGVRRWSPERGTVVWQRTAPGGYSETRLGAAGTVYASMPRGIEQLSLVDGTLIATFDTAAVGYIGADPELRWLAIPTVGSTIDVFDATTRARIATIPHGSESTPLVSADGARLLVEVAGPDGTQEQVLIDRAGTRIASVCDDCSDALAIADRIVMVRRHMEIHGMPRILVVDWNGRRVSEIATISNLAIYDLEADPPTRTIAVADHGGAIELRDLDSGALRTRIPVGDEVHRIVFDRAGRLWALSRNTGVYVHDVATGVLLAHWASAGSYELALSHDTRWALLASETGSVAWRSDIAARVVAPSAARVWRTAFTSDGRLLTSSMDGIAGVFDRDGNELAQWKAHDARLSALQLIGDEQLVTSSRDGSVALWDLQTRRELHRIKDRGHLVEASPDGRLLAIGGDPGVSIWDRERGTLVHDLGAVPHGARALHWSPDGAYVGAIGEHGVVVVWSRDGKQIRTITDDVQPTGASFTIGVDFAFSADSRWLARSGRRQSAKLFSVDGSQADRRLAGIEPVHSTFYVAFDASGLYLGGELLAGRWNVATGARELELPTETTIFWLRTSADRELVFGGGVDQKVHVWDVAQRSEVATIRAPDEVYHLALSPDGTKLAAATLRNTLLFSVEPFAGDVAALRALAACRTKLEVRGAKLVQRPIDVAACNRR